MLFAFLIFNILVLHEPVSLCHWPAHSSLFPTTTNHKQVATSEITESRVNGRGGRPKAHYTTEPAPVTARSPTSQANHVPRVAQRARISLRHEPEMSLFCCGESKGILTRMRRWISSECPNSTKAKHKAKQHRAIQDAHVAWGGTILTTFSALHLCRLRNYSFGLGRVEIWESWPQECKSIVGTNLSAYYDRKVDRPGFPALGIPLYKWDGPICDDTVIHGWNVAEREGI